MPKTKPPSRFLFEHSPELNRAIKQAIKNKKQRGKKPPARNPTLEAWLWKLADIRKAAKQLGITKPERRKPGRPKNE